MYRLMRGDTWFDGYVFFNAIFGFLGFAVCMMLGFAYFMESGRPYTALLFGIIWSVYMMSVPVSDEFWGNSTWWKLNALVWGHATFLVAIVMLIRGIVREMF